MDLPLKLAVLTVVGVAGVAALLSALPSCVVPAPLAAEVVSVNGRPGDALDSGVPAQVEVRVTARGNPVADATVVLTGLGAAAANVSDRNGTALLALDSVRGPGPGGEDYLKAIVSAPGCYQKFENEYALRVVQK